MTTDSNWGQPPAPHQTPVYLPVPPPGYPVPGPPPVAPRKKGLGTGAVVAIVIGAVVAACCGVAGVAAVLGGKDLGTTPPAAGRSQDTVPALVDGTPPPATAQPQPPADAGPPTVKVGGSIDVTTGSATARVTVSKVAKGTSDNQFTQPDKGQFVAVMVDILATTGATDLGPTNFRLIAPDGTVYLTELLVVGMDPQLDPMTKVQQGQRKRGNVVFDVVPGSIAGFKVEITNDRGTVSGYWTT